MSDFFDEFDNLGDAKASASANAKRDGCSWIIWHDKWADTYDVYSPYFITDEFTVPGDYSDRSCHRYKAILKVNPPKMIVDNKEAVYLTPDEKKLVAAVLDPEEIGREYYPGSEDTKVSLLKKILRNPQKKRLDKELVS